MLAYTIHAIHGSYGYWILLVFWFHLVMGAIEASHKPGFFDLHFWNLKKIRHGIPASISIPTVTGPGNQPFVVWALPAVWKVWDLALDHIGSIYWLVVRNIFYFSIFQLTNIFQRGWNHQPVYFWGQCASYWALGSWDQFNPWKTVEEAEDRVILGVVLHNAEAIWERRKGWRMVPQDVWTNILQYLQCGKTKNAS